MNQIDVLKANNVLYHEANLKKLLKLNEVNGKVICLTIGAEKIDKMLSFGKPYGDKSGLGYVENGSSLMATKSKFMRESNHVAPKVNPSLTTKFIPICHHCDELSNICPKCRKLNFGKNDTLKNQEDRLDNEVNKIAQLVEPSSVESVKPCFN
ncbi:hypothetical protein TB1_006428 [Malus domestica]